MREATIALFIIAAVALLCEALYRCVRRKPRTITPAESDAVFTDYSLSWSLWYQWATGGGWHLDCQGTREEMLNAVQQRRAADPEWKREFLICEPGESPALIRKIQ